ncbi:helix-turn-helix domain-containing protein [Novosphingobium kunmingense]|uniref:helix-turn-helix domain-containing protein n=1 Tax=Novosphingobium kunmingense TaxID=1211806 RepID=UPI000C2C32D6|nr:helix-turn-helix domain-containing protein [Novosphingobium kunmingense]
MTAPQLLTEAEAASRLRLCPRTLRKARQDGELSWVQFGRKVLYSETDLAAFIEKARQCPSTSAKGRPSGGTRSPGAVFDFEEARARKRNVTPA